MDPIRHRAGPLPETTTRWLFDVEMIARIIQHHPLGPIGAAASIVESPVHRWRDVKRHMIAPPQCSLAIPEEFPCLFRTERELRSPAKKGLAPTVTWA